MSFGIPLFAPIASYSGLTGEGRPAKRTNVVRLVPSNLEQAAMVVDLLERFAVEDSTLPGKGHLTVHVFVEPTDYGRDMQDQLGKLIAGKEHLRLGLNRRLVLEDSGSVKTSEVVGAWGEQTDKGAIVIAAYVGQTVAILRELAGIVDAQVPIVLTDGAKDPELLRARLPLGQMSVYVTAVTPDWSALAEDTALEPEWNQRTALSDFVARMTIGAWGAATPDPGYAAGAADAMCMVLGSSKAESGGRAAIQWRKGVLAEMRDTGHVFGGALRTYQFTDHGSLKGSHAFLFRAIAEGTSIGRFVPHSPHRTVR